MEINRFVAGDSLTLQARMGTKSGNFKLRVLPCESGEKDAIKKRLGRIRDYTVCEVAKHDGKRINFNIPGVQLSVFGVVDGKPYKWKTVGVFRERYSKGVSKLVLYTICDGARHERRQGYRAFVGVNGMTSSVSQGISNDVLIRDISLGGIGLVVPSDYKVEIGEGLGIKFSDSCVKDSGELRLMTFDLQAYVVRIQELSNGKKILGCRLRGFDATSLGVFIAAKQRYSIKQRNNR